ncbi:MAG: type II toxin-antitoxin system Phd/YefM family antitoxin [Myxococcales bacterium]|nr:type II toxin-antitoxin system Phd/YefM family antitoxin [Myxococcales bacterium]
MEAIVNIHEAKTHFSRLVQRAANGEEIIIARDGQPLARLMPLPARREDRKFGLESGHYAIADDFDVLPPDIQAAFDEPNL